ncbi:MAG: hypothetical protein AB7F43_10335 [Bacteriovoracia bacterium]
MTFNPFVTKAIYEVSKFLPEGATAVDLGNQTLTATDEIFDEIIADASASKTKRSIDLFNAISALRSLSSKERGSKTAEYYRALGFSSYDAIDVNDLYGSLMMDLNSNLRERYNFAKTYDLVTNLGTGEHIFNQLAIFENMHNLAKENGILVHVMPFLNWINHGFFNFNPTLYADIAAANGYKLLKMSVANRWGFEVPVSLDNQTQTGRQPRPFMSALKRAYFLQGPNRVGESRVKTRIRKTLRKVKLHRVPVDPLRLEDFIVQIMPGTLAEHTPLGRALKSIFAHERSISGSEFVNVFVCAAMRKVNSDPFRIPIQSMYSDAVKSNEIKQSYTTA